MQHKAVLDNMENEMKMRQELVKPNIVKEELMDTMLSMYANTGFKSWNYITADVDKNG